MTAEDTSFASLHRTVIRIEHMLGHKICLNQVNRLENMQGMFSNSVEIRDSGQNPKCLKLDNILLNNFWVKEDECLGQRRESFIWSKWKWEYKLSKLGEYHKNSGKKEFIAKSAYITKEERSVANFILKNRTKFKKINLIGVPGWLSWLSIRLLISAQVMISRFMRLIPVSGSVLIAWSLPGILSLSLSLCPSPVLSRSPSK